MEWSKVLLLAVLALTVLSCCVVEGRPHNRAIGELTDIASNMAHTLEEVIDMLSTEQTRSRRRRMVQFHVSRHHHHPRYRFHRGSRRLRYRKQRASRNPDISDH